MCYIVSNSGWRPRRRRWRAADPLLGGRCSALDGVVFMDRWQVAAMHVFCSSVEAGGRQWEFLDDSFVRVWRRWFGRVLFVMYIGIISSRRDGECGWGRRRYRRCGSLELMGVVHVITDGCVLGWRRRRRKRGGQRSNIGLIHTWNNGGSRRKRGLWSRYILPYRILARSCDKCGWLVILALFIYDCLPSVDAIV